MKSMLFSALVIFALASTGCALQNGVGGGVAGGECLALSGDCGCSAPSGFAAPSGGLLRSFSDKRGMGLRVNAKGSACNQGRNNGLFARMGRSSVAPAASIGCGCGGGDSIVSNTDGACGCEGVVGSGGGGLLGRAGGCGCKLGSKLGGCKLGGCKLGGCKLGGCKLGGCKLGGCKLGGGCGLGKGLLGGGAGAIAGGGCGLGGGLGCDHLSDFVAAGAQPYGGAIPHTAQAPGNGTGLAPSYAYPYYTTRGPRDFLMKNPPSIGY